MTYGCLHLSISNNFGIEFSNHIEAFLENIFRTTQILILATICNHQKKSKLFRLVLVTVFQSHATSTTKSCVVALDKSQPSLVVGDNGVGWKLFSVQIPIHDKIRIYVCGASIQQLFWLLFSTNAQRPHGTLNI